MAHGALKHALRQMGWVVGDAAIAAAGQARDAVDIAADEVVAAKQPRAQRPWREQSPYLIDILIVHENVDVLTWCQIGQRIKPSQNDVAAARGIQPCKEIIG
ncbi:MAG: hypothetical protein ACK4TL_05880 [Hyphomicrobiaceae bacterium]